MDTSNLILAIALFLFIIALIALLAWGFKAFFSSSNAGPSFLRSREKRLGVSETYNIDGKRRLMLVRRDDKEHLLMIGGPVDVIIETEIEARRPLEHPLEDVVIDPGERRQAPPEDYPQS
ncbi:flagellar biosynthetic protein FliO [Methyloligella sp. 2.7D]|uniref:flagellar biosynthetic protein FliO n=1 Tax=unclassified Methyloligella TaxID=2625955 RepID=UPI00157CA43D|nr:flagellar biosynthetic protein FliO [Methyloligella sp. GL2]QKP77866.1 flagellar biosynthetic protein FliO [Methyloligella sp. GL2]